MRRGLAQVFLLLMYILGLSAPTALARPKNDTCAGLRRLPVETPEGSCLAVVIEGSPLRIPRKIVQVPGQELFVISDVGDWRGGNLGKLFLLDNRGPSPSLRELLGGLNFPHALAVGPDGKIYASDQKSLVRLDPSAFPEARVEIVIANLPHEEASLHPLRHFIFGQSPLDRWDIYVNLGATGDTCLEELDASGLCREREDRGLLMRYRYLGDNRWSQNGEIFARGLRNSMGLVSHPSGTLLQADNARNNNDLLTDPHEPFDEINLVYEGEDYGWPYCYNFSAVSPEWIGDPRIQCSQYHAPWALLPPHSAPLDALYYRSDFHPSLTGRLLLSLHGLAFGTGHRVVSLEVDLWGRPLPSTERFAWPYTAPGSRDGWRFETPQGGLIRHSPIVPVVGGWAANARLGLARGAPVGLLEDEGGRLWIVDDKNAMILRLDHGLAYAPVDEEPGAEPSGPEPLSEAEILADPFLQAGWEIIHRDILRPRCAACHRVGLGALIEHTNWIRWNDMAESPWIQRIEGRGNRPIMPPARPLTDEEIELTRAWLMGLDALARGPRRATP